MKKLIFQIIQPDQGNSLASRVFDWFITTLILLNVVSVYAVTFDLPHEVKNPMARFEDFAALCWLQKSNPEHWSTVQKVFIAQCFQRLEKLRDNLSRGFTG